MEESRYDVVIVGAGLAGARVADLLRDSGRRVLLLEARERVGGRLWSEPADGCLVDRGGQWLGRRQPRVLRLASELGLTRVATHMRGRHVYQVGSARRVVRWPLSALGLSGTFATVRALWRLERLARRVDGERPWDSPAAAELDASSARAWFEAQLPNPDARGVLAGLLESLLCCPLDAISPLELAHQLRSVGSFAALETAEAWSLAEGAQRLVGGLLERAGAALRCSEPVLAVDDRGDDALVTTERGAYLAARVVLAVPPQLRERIDFTPLLPAPQSAPVVRGQVVKLVARYPRPWWRALGLSGVVMAPAEPIGVLMDGGAGDDDPGVLVGLAGGPRGAAVPTDATALAAAWSAHTRRWLSPDAPEPEALRCTDWTGDPWALGGYAARPGIGAWTAHHPSCEPVGRLHFAGTETARAWRSYMEGALESAERVAAELDAGFSSSR